MSQSSPSPSPQKRPRNRLRRLLLWCAALVVLYTLTGFFLLPVIVKYQLIKQLPVYTHRKASIDQVRINPFALSLTVRGLALTETDGTRFASFDSLYVNAQLSSILHRGLVCDEISLTNLEVAVTRGTNGVFNFANLLPPTTTPTATSTSSAPLPYIQVARLNIDRALIAMLDLSRPHPFATTITPLTLHLNDFTTQPGAGSPYSFNAVTEAGEQIIWSGTVGANPIQSRGTFKISGLQLKKYFPYSEEYSTAEILDGVLDLGADYQIAIGAKALEAEISHGSVHLANLQLKAPEDTAPFLILRDFSIESLEASLARRTAAIGKITATGGNLTGRRNRDGSFQILSLIKRTLDDAPAPTGTAAAAVSAAPATPWNASIAGIRLDDFALTWVDQTTKTPAQLKLDRINVNLSGLSNQTNATVQTSVSLRWNESGTMRLSGPVTVLPTFSGDIKVALEGLDLRPLQPYVTERIQLGLRSGALSANVDTTVRVPPGAPPELSIHATLAVTNLAAVDTVTFQDFVVLDALEVGAIDVTLPANRVKVDQVKLTGLKTSLIILSNKVSNLEVILGRSMSTTNVSPDLTESQIQTAAPAATAAPKLPAFSLAALVLEHAGLRFVDQSIQPNCFFEVQDLGGSVRDLSTERFRTAPVEFKGRVDEASSFSVSGRVNPLPGELMVDLAIGLKNMDLTAFTPYMEKFGGYPLGKGKLSLNLGYNIDHLALKASNVIHLDQLTLGPFKAGPDATKLPVRLGVALLKDRNGRIALDVPVAGRLDDPKFRVAPIIWQVVMNMLVKAATSPFALIGSMFGGGEELSFVEFPPGQTDLAPAEIKKLSTLATALYERPALNLEIKGSADPARDRPALARQILDTQIKLLRLKELTAAGEGLQSTDQVKLDPAETGRLLRALYQQTIGTNQNVATHLAVVIATNLTVASVAPVVAATPKPRAKPVASHGAEALMTGFGRPHSSTSPAPTVPAPQSSAPTPAPDPSVDTPELTADAMIAALLGRIEITVSDLQKLMQDRAKAVQIHLLSSQKVTAERLFLLAPKPTDGASTGELRANLTLN